ncbi:uncharacterized protein LOC144981320 isoform X2 [Oryzias latipes]
MVFCLDVCELLCTERTIHDVWSYGDEDGGVIVEFISERLAAAAEEIFRHCEGTIVQYEQELCRQRRLLDITRNPRLQLHAIVLPPYYASESVDQQRNSRVEKEEPGPPQVEEEQKQTEPPQFKEEQEEQEPLQIKEELEERELQQIEENWGELQPLQIKEEQEKLCISHDEDQLELKQETYTLMETSINEENEHNIADQNNRQSFNITDNQDEERSQHEESSTTDGETDPQNKNLKKRRDVSCDQNIYSSHMLESQKSNTATLVKQHNQILNKKIPSYIKSGKSSRIVSNLCVYRSTESDKKTL